MASVAKRSRAARVVTDCFALLALSIGGAAAARPPLAMLVDPAGVLRESHRTALRVARPAGKDDDAAFRARLSPQGQRYRLPVVGRLIVADGTASGLLLVPPPDAQVVAPRLSRIAYAGPFRRYGDVVILDHGHGWTTVLTGLDRLDAAQGMTLTGGEILGRAGALVRIQLLHHGRPADLARIAGLVIPPQAPLR